MVFYRLNYDNHTQVRHLLRKIFLLGAIVADFFAICSIIQIAVEGAVFVLQMLGLIVLSTIIRIISVNLLLTYEYKFCGSEFTVASATALKSKNVICLNTESDFELIKYDGNNFAEKYLINLCGKCSEDKYVLIYNNKKYLLALDEYMYALVNNLRIASTEER